MAWSFSHWRKDATLYVHFPCFDGVVSGVLAILFLENVRHWRFRTIRPVNYSEQDEWINSPLAKHAAVVDFLYHPAAEFWADHHPTSFLNDGLRADFERRKGKSRFYDRRIGSCASLLWREAAASLGCDPRLQDMVRWADKIDSAAYESVEEALFTDHPALVLSRSLAIDAHEEYCRFLILRLKKETLEQVARTDEVQKRFVKAQELSTLGLDRVRNAIGLQGDIAVLDTDGEGVFINRYSPYYFYPQARYSVTIIRSQESVKITVMRNPWLNFESANLGEFMRRFKGGGHRRVGSVILQKTEEPEVKRIVSELLHELALPAELRVQA